MDRRCRCVRVDRNGIKFNPKPNDVLGRHTEATPGEDLSNSKILKVPDICIGPAHRTPRAHIVRLSLSTMVSGTTPYVPK